MNRKIYISGLLVVGLALRESHAADAQTFSATNEVAASRLEKNTNLSKTGEGFKTGILPNGMRYYIKNNPIPAGRVDFWLSVNAGSAQEDDDQKGFAHFLEHMAFNGTRSFPGNKINDIIEHAGMNFGPDLNAYTSFEETVYMLTMPTDKKEYVDQGLQILQEWADGGILLDSMEVVAERGVVIGEMRSRQLDTLSERIQMEGLAAMYGSDSRWLSRIPIGKLKQLQTANPSALRRFYQDWYRPDLMAVIIVGDINVDEMYREVEKRFGSIIMPENPRPRKVTSVLQSDTSSIYLMRFGRYPTNNVLWKAPQYSEDPSQRVRNYILEQFVFDNLNTKYLKSRQSEKRSFAFATAGRAELIRGAGSVYALTVMALPDSLRYGTLEAIRMLSGIAENGLTDAELKYHRASLERQHQAMVDGAGSASSKQLAGAMSAHFLSGRGDYIDAIIYYDYAKKILPTITSSDISEFVKSWLYKDPRNFLYYLPPFSTAALPTLESSRTLLDSAFKTSSLASVSINPEVGDVDLMSAKPQKGKIVMQISHKRSAVEEWHLSNGARVFYRFNPSYPDEVVLQAYSQGGHSLLPDSLFTTPGRLVAPILTAVAGGLGDANKDELIKITRGSALRGYRVGLYYLDEEVMVSGSPRELETLFQLMHLTFTKPGLDSASIASWKNYGVELLGATWSQNDGFLASKQRGGNPRIQPPTPAQVPFITADQAKAVFNDRFGDASDFDFIIIGAVSRDEAKEFVETYIANLPSTNRARREKPVPVDIPLNQFVRKSSGKAFPVYKSRTVLSFEGKLSKEGLDYVRESRKLTAFNRILTRRLRDKMREQLGATYGVSVSHGYFSTPDTYWYMQLQFESYPDHTDSLNVIFNAEIDSIRKYGPTTGELEYANMVLNRVSEMRTENNWYWTAAITKANTLGIPIDDFVFPQMNPITFDDILDAAKKYIPDNRYVQMVYRPAIDKPVELIEPEQK